MSIVRINEFKAAAGKADGLREFLGSVIAQIKGAAGCQRVELLADHEDATRFAIVEAWDSIEAHQAAATRVPPEKMAEVQALLGDTPRGRYYDPLSS
jgi:quinol monooxygenase YgiN